MILNIVRTAAQLKGYLSRIEYPLPRMLIYIAASLSIGWFLASSQQASELPILTVTAVLFGFTINAVVMLGNSSEHYTGGETDQQNQIEHLFEKSLFISIHTLGIGILTIVVGGALQLFPNLGFSIYGIGLIRMASYTLVVYYLIVFSTVIATVSELVLIKVSP